MQCLINPDVNCWTGLQYGKKLRLLKSVLARTAGQIDSILSWLSNYLVLKFSKNFDLLTVVAKKTEIAVPGSLFATMKKKFWSRIGSSHCYF